MNKRYFKVFNMFEDKVLSKLGVAAFVVATLLVIVEVVTRYIFSYSSMWVGETVTYAVACCAFLYFGLAEKANGRGSGHLRTTLLVQMIKNIKIKKTMRIIATLIAMLYTVLFFILVVPTVRMFYVQQVKSLNSGWPVWIFYAVLALGMLLLFVDFLQVLIIKVKDPAGASSIEDK